MEPTILIVDDSLDSRLLLKKFLNREGYYNVILKETASQALELLKSDSEFSVDLILLDIVMPGMDGIEVCRLLKEHDKLEDIPIIMVTGLGKSTVLEQAFNAGAMDFIKKPIDPIEIKARISFALRLKEEMDKRKLKEKQLMEVNKELQQVNQLLEQLSMFDGLTGIANRRKFDEYYTTELARAKKNQSSLSLIMLDIDHFKYYNDTYGHLEGDDCLRTIAKTLAQTLKRPTDLVARYGGEEFVIVLPDVCYEEALKLGDELRANIESRRIPHETSLISNVVTVSVGVSTLSFTSNEMDVSTHFLIEMADKALYKSKETGRNRVTGMKKVKEIL
ncbi:GGDEF domain-containing response regulator [Bacillus sp. FJAT-45350]|uniref:GGDEF domain-containing response regulator n=1 Tax=Bacillus sp. FJAT-45350 TaxID=2011014 RepID=UPI000BB8AA11|nr:diguanylate cyclase [Bacillus sp. FJAT-45350]